MKYFPIKYHIKTILVYMYTQKDFPKENPKTLRRKEIEPIRLTIYEEAVIFSRQNVHFSDIYGTL